MQNTSKNINRLMGVIWKRKWRICLGALIGAVIMWVLSTVVIQPVYTASMSMYVYGNSNRSATEEAALTESDITVSQSLAETYSVIIQSNTVMEKIIKRLNLDMTKKELKDKITTTAVDNTEVLSVEVTDKDKKRAADIANTIAKVLPGEISRVVKNGGIEIVDYAETPEEPTFPNVWLNTAAGAFAGLLLMCGVYLLKEYFRTKVRNEDDLREYFGIDIPILGTIPKLD